MSIDPMIKRNDPHMNIAFYDDHLDFCRTMAWEKHQNVTQYVNDLIAKEKTRLNRDMPLSLDSLIKMMGEPVWVKVIDRSVFADPRDAFDDWGLVRPSWVRMWDKSRADIVTVKHCFEDYGRTWVAYRSKPRGE